MACGTCTTKNLALSLNSNSASAQQTSSSGGSIFALLAALGLAGLWALLSKK